MRGERRLGGGDDRIGIEAADDADDDVGAGVLAADVVEQVGARMCWIVRRLPITGWAIGWLP